LLCFICLRTSFDLDHWIISVFIVLKIAVVKWRGTLKRMINPFNSLSRYYKRPFKIRALCAITRQSKLNSLTVIVAILSLKIY
jgi:hypothetical protein